MSKYLQKMADHSKKILVGIAIIILGFGIVFGDKSRINYYMDQVIELISGFDEKYLSTTSKLDSLEY